MKYDPGDDYSTWLEKVRMYEYGQALQQIAQGVPADQVLEQMSRRMVQKGMHPILKAIHDIPTNYDSKESQRRYAEIMKNKGPNSDHVLDDDNK